jgi:hypothetical protein
VVALAVTVAVVIVAVAIAMISHRYYVRQANAATAPPTARATTGSASPSPSLPAVVQASLPSTGSSYLGVYEGSTLTTDQFAQVEQFAAAVGRQPNIVMYYSGWGESFSIPYAQTALAHDATLQVDLDPTSTTAAAITAGQQDGFLQSFAQSVKAFGHPVIISFGHEMNGNWYSWGYQHTSPAVFVAAWRHIVDVFRAAGAENVTWMWTVNQVGNAAQEGPIADWWPGDNYVTWVGMDAYYYQASDDFSSVFGPTIAAIRQLTSKPILIGETAVGPIAGQAAKIPGLFAGVAADGLLGLIWYDVPQNNGPYHQDWQVEGNPAAVAAFRTSAAQYIK